MVYSIIKKSELEGALRLDAEYYQPEYFIDFKKGKWAPIGKFLESCQYGLSKAMNIETGYPIFRMNDIKNGFLVDDELKFADISTELFNQYKLDKNDVLFNRVNSEEFVGRTGIFKMEKDFIFASYLIRLKVNKGGKILSDYLNIFLNSSFGKKQIRKFSRRAVNQANVNAEELKKIKIAVLPLPIQRNIKLLSDKSWSQFNQSKLFYNQAEELLLKELELKDFKSGNELYNIVNLADVKDANRIDAEYFQVKYEKLVSKIKNKNTQSLENYIKNYSTGTPFKSNNYQENGVPLIRINNIKKGYLDLTNTAYLSERAYLMALKDIAKPGDIVLSMSGNVGMSAIVPDDIPKSSVNQRILKFTSKNINKDYLVFLLNSIVGSYQLERIGTGGVQTNISYRDIKNLLIPTLPKLTQQKIADLVIQSHQARKEAEQLLEEAKQKVEDLIEK